MDILSLLFFLLLGAGILGVALSLLTGFGVWLVQLFYAAYRALFVKEDKNKGRGVDYSIEQGKEVR